MKLPKLDVPVLSCGRQRWLTLFVVALATAAVFLPSVRFQFVNFDDNKFIVGNMAFRGLGWTNLRWMFTTFLSGPYQPLSWLSYAFDHALWGMNPVGYHLTNVILHTANAALFCLALIILLPIATPGKSNGERDVCVAAGFGALVFALHPLRAESVAWVTERRDVLSGFFYAATLVLYLDAHTSSRTPAAGILRTRAALAVYALSLLAKGMGIGLPLILMVLDIYPLNRVARNPRDWFSAEARRVWAQKMPFFALAAATALVGAYGQFHGGAVLFGLPASNRIAYSLYSVAFYPWKTLWPLDLIPLYEIPLAKSALDPTFLLSGFAALGAVVIFAISSSAWPAGLAAFACYLFAIVPVAGPVKFGPQIVADRYSYLPCLPWAALAGGGLLYGMQRLSEKPKLLMLATAALLIMALAWRTSDQLNIWRDSESLWRHTLAADPANNLAHNNLAVELTNTGRREEAVRLYRHVLSLSPDYADAHYNLAILLEDQGSPQEAMHHYRESLRFKPRAAEPHVALGVILAGRLELTDAAVHYRKAIEIDPSLAQAHNNLASVLWSLGHYDESVEHFAQATRLRPDYALARANLDRAAKALAAIRSAGAPASGRTPP